MYYYYTYLRNNKGLITYDCPNLIMDCLIKTKNPRCVCIYTTWILQSLISRADVNIYSV